MMRLGDFFLGPKLPAKATEGAIAKQSKADIIEVFFISIIYG